MGGGFGPGGGPGGFGRHQPVVPVATVGLWTVIKPGDSGLLSALAIETDTKKGVPRTIV